MSLLNELAASRREAEALMLESCEVRRPLRPVTDAEGRVTTPTEVVYPDPAWPAEHEYLTGPCRVQSYQAYEQTHTAAGATQELQRYRVDFPVTSFAPLAGDIVEIVASPTAPWRVGRRYRLAGPFSKTLATATRCFADEIPDGTGGA